MRKVVINSDFGGFGLSTEARTLYKELAAKLGRPETYNYDSSRDDPILIQVVETLGPKAAGHKISKLKIVEIPIDVDWEIKEYDGGEWAAEKHRTWS